MPLAARPALADAVRRLQAMHAAVPASQGSRRREGSGLATSGLAIMNPAYEDGALADASEL